MPETTRAGYDFLGWYYDVTLKNKVGDAGDAYVVDGSQTLYAKWEANLYTIKYHNNLNYLASSDSVIVTLSGRNYYKKYDEPALVGYLYNGTYTGPVLVGTTENSVAYYTSYDSTTTFSFGGTLEYDGVTYYYGTDQGYWIEGDITDTSGLADRVKYSGITVEEAARQILADQDVTMEQEMYYGTEEELLTNTYSKTGYTFVGWSTSPTGSKEYEDNYSLKSVTTYVDNILNLYAIWDVNSYNVNYIGNKFNYSNRTVTNGLTISYDTSTSYFSLNGTPTGAIDLMKLGDQTFVEGEEYSITLDYVSGTISTADSVYISFVTDIKKIGNASLTIRNFRDVNFVNSDNSNTLTVNSSAASEGNVLYCWIYSNDYSNVTFTNYKVKVTITKKESVTIPYGHIYDSLGTTPSRKGYEFPGWYTAESGGSQINANTVMATDSNHDIYAQWTGRTVTITYDANGGSGTMSNTTFTYGGTNPTSSANSFTKTGYTFQYWMMYRPFDDTYYGCSDTSVGCTSGAGNTTIFWRSSSTLNAYYPLTSWAISSKISADDMTFKAKWNANTYTVTLNNQSATTAGTTSVTATYDSAMPSITKPSRAYTVTYNANSGSVSPSSATATYTFGGYYTGTSGSGTQYYTADGASARNWDLTSATTLYAKWTSSSVTFPTPTRSGYTFLEWYTATSSGTLVGAAGATYTPTANITLYALWRANNYQISSGSATYADTLANAISWANAGATITLLNSITDSSTATFNKNLTFDFNGYDLTRGSVVTTIGSSVTVTFSGSGGIVSTSTVTVQNEGTFYLNGPTILNAGGSSTGNTYRGLVISKTSGKVYLQNGKIYSKYGTAVIIQDDGADRSILSYGTAGGTYTWASMILYGAKYAIYCDGSPYQTILWYNGSMYSASA